MIIEISSTNCCGLHELSNIDAFINRPEACIREFCVNASEYDNDPLQGAFILFTGVTKRKYGQQLASYIRKHKLGQVIQTSSKRNLRSGNTIKAWVWTLDRVAIRQWAAKREIYIPRD